MNVNTKALIELLKNTKKNPIFFFCGSGIGYASNLPNVQDILQATCKAFFPKEVSLEDIHEISKSIQPEIFYENLLQATNNNYDSLDIWKCLYDNDNQPNLAHLFIVQYSYKNKSPIITTNFDLMFEKAAQQLKIDYQILLPNDNPNDISDDTLYICKIHGSIAGSDNQYNPKSLLTTMTSITQKNTIWINYLTQLMENKHICFVGYSGRDIDFYPFLEKQSKLGSSKAIWIDKFDEHSNKRSEACKAIRLNQYPVDSSNKTGFLFEYIKEDSDYYYLYNENNLYNKDLNAKIKELTNKLINKNILENEQGKCLFYICVLHSLGRYKVAHNLALELYKNKNKLSVEHTKLLLLRLSQLSHENSQYVSCGKLAKELKQINKKKQPDVNYTLMSTFLYTESLRMQVPSVEYFPYKRGIGDYFFLLRVIGSFVYVIVFVHLTLILRNISSSQLSPKTKHEFIEHKIRLFAIIQAIFCSSNKGATSVTSMFMSKVWEKLKQASYQEGYSGGIANSQKFKIRLFPDNKDRDEALEIFTLTTSSSGKEILARDLADEALKEGNYSTAKKKFDEYVNQANNSGNILNQAKGYIGLAYVNYEQGHLPLLDTIEFQNFTEVCNQVEGKLWKKYLTSICKKIKGD